MNVRQTAGHVLGTVFLAAASLGILSGGAQPALAGAATPQSTCGTQLPSGAKVVGKAATPTGQGYWEVDQFGDVAALGNASCFGSLASTSLNQPVVGMAATPNGGGYWLVAADGGIFAFGDAGFYGSMGGKPLNQPVVGMASTPDGKGYWEVAADGGIFSFGDAGFYGSMGGKPLNQPVVGMASTPDGKGYWEVAADGGIFSFGDASFYGSMGGKPLNQPVVGMAATPNGGGYWEVAADGGVFAFGDAGFYGRAVAPQVPADCTSSQLSATLGLHTAGAGSQTQTVTFLNTSGQTCTLYGYPGLQMFASSGQPLATHVSRSTNFTESNVTLSPGQQASFYAHWASRTGFANDVCPTSSQVEITPPNAYQGITLSWQISPYGGTVNNLHCGEISVSPVFSGTTPS